MMLLIGRGESVAVLGLGVGDGQGGWRRPPWLRRYVYFCVGERGGMARRAKI